MRTRVVAIAGLCLTLGAGPGAAPSAAESDLPTPQPLAGIGIDERTGERVPLDLELRGRDGAPVRLREWFGEAPVILVLGYYRCTMLCGRVLDGTARSVASLARSPDAPAFRVISVSIDPRDDARSAAARRAAVLAALGWSPERERWPFLTGGVAQVRTLSRRVGFEYRYDADTDQYAHPAALIVLSPDGRIAGYLYGVEFGAEELTAALRAAAAGETRPTLERVLLRCFRYVPALRRYADELRLFFRAGAVASVVLSVGVVLALGRRARARRAAS